MTESAETSRVDIVELIAPLSPFAMLEFCRAVFESGAELDAIPTADYPKLAEHEPATLRAVYERLLDAYPELRELTEGPSTVEPARAMFLRMFYELLSRSNAADKMGFLNLGYDLEPGDRGPELEPEDEPNRYSIQLYHQLYGPAFGPDQVAGKDVVEVGCGRGGGSDYVARYLGPRSVTGVDITRASIDYCKRSYAVEGLGFVVGQATQLPLDDGCCDVVMNLESSHCYPSMPDFLAEVRRVLRPGGHFVFSDIRHVDTLFRGYEPVEVLDQQLAASGLELLERRDITAPVARAIEIDGEALTERWDAALGATEGLDEDAAGYCRKHFRYAVGVSNEAQVTWHQRFVERSHIYLSYVLRKPA